MSHEVKPGDNNYNILVLPEDMNGVHTVEYDDGTQISFWDWLRDKIFGGWDNLGTKDEA